MPRFVSRKAISLESEKKVQEAIRRFELNTNGNKRNTIGNGDGKGVTSMERENIS